MRLMPDRLFIRILTASSLSLAAVPALVLSTSNPVRAASDSSSSKPMTLLKLGVVGNKQVSTAALDQAMTVHVGQKVTRADLAANFNAVVDAYRRANVGAHFKQKMVIPHPGAVRVEYIIAEQAPPPPQAPAVLRLDKVTFEGNKRLSDQKIQSAIGLRPGEAVSNASVAATQQAIVALYKKAEIGVKVTPSATYPQPNHVVVNYRLDEQPGG